MHYESDVIKDWNKRKWIILQQSCNYLEDERNDKNRLNKIRTNDNNLIHSFTNFKIKYNSLLIKTLNILN